jgi:hypothetical protein
MDACAFAREKIRQQQKGPACLLLIYPWNIQRFISLSTSCRIKGSPA